MTLESTSLHRHAPRPHAVQNANAVHAARHVLAGFNKRLAVLLTTSVGSMICAYAFGVLAFIGLLGVIGALPASVYTFVAWLSQTFLQLVLLSVIMVGTNVVGEKGAIQSDEQFKLVQNTEHDEEQNIQHLAAQDRELVKQTRLLLALLAGVLVALCSLAVLFTRSRSSRRSRPRP